MRGSQLTPPEYVQVKTYGEGRRCVHCAMPLSVYNPGSYCTLHEYMEPPTNLNTYFKACERCGEFKCGRAFERDDATWDGLTEVCSRCFGPDALREQRDTMIAIRNKSGRRTCARCKKKKPATLEHFHYASENNTLLRAVCRECANKKARQRRERERDERTEES